ncbi:MAG: glycerol dehydrogenase, partial [Thermoplasmata archaeon]
MTGRELAWRVLATELLSSSAEERGSGDKSPSYVISPLGARMNRVLVTGTIPPADGAGADPSAGFVRARLT